MSGATWDGALCAELWAEWRDPPAVCQPALDPAPPRPCLIGPPAHRLGCHHPPFALRLPPVHQLLPHTQCPRQPARPVLTHWYIRALSMIWSQVEIYYLALWFSFKSLFEKDWKRIFSYTCKCINLYAGKLIISQFASKQFILAKELISV